MVFAGYFGFLHYLQLASHDLVAIIGRKSGENRYSKKYKSHLGQVRKLPVTLG